MLDHENEQLRLARLVQDALLPPPVVQLPSLAAAARFLPSANVSGDFLDCFPLGSRHLAFYLGDVQGKGLAAAFYALLISGLMRGLHKRGTEPADLVAALNRRLCYRSPLQKFCCLSYALFDGEQGQLKYTSAGLPFPLLLRNGTVTPIELTGLPVGIFEPYECDQVVLDLQPGDRLLFYTDGLPDSLLALRPQRGDGAEQLQSLLAADPAVSVQLKAAKIVAHLPLSDSCRAHLLFDDVTFLVAQVL
jgi:serine phosphatase RsbU (regulator of sigma subunit)